MTRDVQMGNDIYLVLLNKQHELNISKASTLGNVRIIDRAVTQLKPVKPKKLLIVILSAMLGFLFLIGDHPCSQHADKRDQAAGGT